MNKSLLVLSFILSAAVLSGNANAAPVDNQHKNTENSKIEFTQEEEEITIESPVACEDGEEKNDEGKCVPKED